MLNKLEEKTRNTLISALTLALIIFAMGCSTKPHMETKTFSTLAPTTAQEQSFSHAGAYANLFQIQKIADTLQK